jgi:hypothetical protein
MLVPQDIGGRVQQDWGLRVVVGGGERFGVRVMAAKRCGVV